MTPEQTVYVVDDDEDVRDSLEVMLGRRYRVRTFASARDYLDAGVETKDACVLADIRMPEMDGLALQREIKRRTPSMPIIIMTGHGDVPMAVQAMKEGALEFLEKPFDRGALLAALDAAFQAPAPAETVPDHKPLTAREQQVFDLLVLGHQNKVIAHKLAISTRTVEVHRARIMDKLGAKNLADLVRRSLQKP